MKELIINAHTVSKMEQSSNASAIRQAMEQGGLKYKTSPEGDLFQFNIKFDRPRTVLQFSVRAIGVFFMIVSQPTICVDVNNRNLMRKLATLILRINSRSKILKFSIDFSNKRLQLEFACPLQDGFQLTPKLVHKFILLSFTQWTTYGAYLLNVVGGKSSEEAIKHTK